VQVRERDLPGSDLATLVRAMVALARGSHTRILVNDRLDVAIAAGAAGVHLRSDSVAPAIARTMVPPGFLIGRSVHDAIEAGNFGDVVDYLVAGTVWPTPSKPMAPGADYHLLGVDGLTAIVRASRAPVLAIGGVTLERIPQVAQAGAAGLAAIGLFMPSRARADKGAECTVGSLHQLAAALRARFDEVGPPPRGEP
jgi:thiamine-phosphate pyrophosphorylase